MSKTVLAQIQGWTPVLDRLVERHGIITAAVFGKIWRYCQGDYGVCTASQERIADELGLSRKAVNEHCQVLVDNGYLTVTANGRTNTYKDTGKAGLLLQIAALVSEPVTEGYTQDDTTCNLELQQMSPKVTTDVTESYTKKVVKRVTRDTTTTTENPEKNIYAIYEKNIAPLTPMVADELDDCVKTYTLEWVIEAIKEAAKSEVHNIKYITAILRRWKSQGFKSQKPQSRSTGNKPPSSQAEANRRALAEAAERDKKRVENIILEEDEDGNVHL